MFDRELFKGMPEFLAVARRKSFRQAGEDLGVTAVAVGTAVKQLEERLGMALFHRTTRRVALTASGEILFERMAPLTDSLRETMAAMRDRQHTLTGNLRICTQSLALESVVNPALVRLHEDYPGISVDVYVRNEPTDLTAGEFDLGIRLGEYIEEDMVAVRIPLPVNWQVAGRRDYLEQFGRPTTPQDILKHRCIRRIWPNTSHPYRWEFQIEQRLVEVDPPGQFSVASFSAAMHLVGAGAGLCYLTTEMINKIPGDIEKILEEYMPPPNYLYAYFLPAERENRRIRAFLDCLCPSPGI